MSTEHVLALSQPSIILRDAEDFILMARPGMTWECSCGKWFKARNPRTGAPFEDGAKRLHRKHVASVDSK